MAKKRETLAETALRAKALGITSVEKTEHGTTITIDPSKHNTLGGENGEQLKSLIQRIERLEEEKKTVSDDIKEVYSEAKSNGYDARIVRKVIAIRKRDYNERMEEETLIDLYLGAVGEKV